MQQKVARLCKITTLDVETVSMLKDALNKAQYDIARQRPESVPDLLQLDFSIDPSLFNDSPTPINLPADFMRVDQVNYKVTVPATITWQLCERNKRVPPAKVFGRPTSYVIVGSTQEAFPPYAIRINPIGSIVGTDVLLIDYYKAPTLMVADGDTLNSNINDEEVINRAEQYMMLYRGAVQLLQPLQSINQLTVMENVADKSNSNDNS